MVGMVFRTLRLLVISLAVAASAAQAQPPTVGRVRTVGSARVNGVPRECMYSRMNSCDWASRADVRIRTGSRPVRVRILGLAYTQDLRERPLRWRPTRVSRLQVRTGPVVAGTTSLSVPANGDVEIGVIHPRMRYRDGIDYRIDLEIDGHRVRVFASDHLIVEHPEY